MCSHFGSGACYFVSSGLCNFVSLIMQCPSCSLMRAKRCWRPSQWVKCTPVTDLYKQCKVCDGEIPNDQGWEESRPIPAQVPLSREARPMPVFTDVMPDHALWLVEKAANLNTNEFGDFVDRWMELPEQTRRVWSYNGAVTSRLGDPLCYHCPYAWANYFDPSNWVYTQTMNIMCPSLMARVNWNMKTKCNLCESIMGAHYNWSVLMPRFRPELQASCDSRFGYRLKCCSSLIDCFAWHTYHLQQEVRDEQLVEWITWIISMVSWRKSEFLPGTHVVLEQKDNEVLGPRDKSMGCLDLGIPDMN